MISSFPFFNIAREYGVDYGHVLSYRSALMKMLRVAGGEAVMGHPLTPWEIDALAHLHNTVAGDVVREVHLQEQGRRHIVIHGDCRHD